VLGTGPAHHTAGKLRPSDRLVTSRRAAPFQKPNKIALAYERTIGVGEQVKSRVGRHCLHDLRDQYATRLNVTFDQPVDRSGVVRAAERLLAWLSEEWAPKVVVGAIHDWRELAEQRGVAFAEDSRHDLSPHARERSPEVVIQLLLGDPGQRFREISRCKLLCNPLTAKKPGIASAEVAAERRPERVEQL
jgi:hypothetical protein